VIGATVTVNIIMDYNSVNNMGDASLPPDGELVALDLEYIPSFLGEQTPSILTDVVVGRHLHDLTADLTGLSRMTEECLEDLPPMTQPPKRLVINFDPLDKANNQNKVLKCPGFFKLKTGTWLGLCLELSDNQLQHGWYLKISAEMREPPRFKHGHPLQCQDGPRNASAEERCVFSVANSQMSNLTSYSEEVTKSGTRIVAKIPDYNPATDHIRIKFKEPSSQTKSKHWRILCAMHNEQGTVIAKGCCDINVYVVIRKDEHSRRGGNLLKRKRAISGDCFAGPASPDSGIGEDEQRDSTVIKRRLNNRLSDAGNDQQATWQIDWASMPLFQICQEVNRATRELEARAKQH